MIYSPSQTEAWWTCPLLRHLKQDWQPRVLGTRQFGTLRGRVFARCMAVRQLDPSLDLMPPAAAELHSSMVGRTVREEDQAEFDAIAQQMVNLAAKVNLVPPDWTIIGVEAEFPEYGNVRMDLVAETPTGLTVLDWKYRGSLTSFYHQRELERLSVSGQMYQYAWTLEQVYDRPVPRFYIGLVVEKPFKAQLLAFEIHPERMEMWRQSAQVAWARMAEEDAGIVPVAASVRHWTEYGPCEMFGACFGLGLEPVAMMQAYSRREERHEIPKD